MEGGGCFANSDNPTLPSYVACLIRENNYGYNYKFGQLLTCTCRHD